MSISSVLIADSSQTSRSFINDILVKRGYKLYQASDGSGAMRIARSIRPDLILMDVNLWRTNVYETAGLIEREGLSTVVFITAKPDRDFAERLKPMKVFAYITKPINPVQLVQIVEFSLVNSNRIIALEKRLEKLESSLSSRKSIERAKGVLMEKLKITEGEAYSYLRKRSMDECIPMESVASRVIEKFHG